MGNWTSNADVSGINNGTSIDNNNTDQTINNVPVVKSSIIIPNVISNLDSIIKYIDLYIKYTKPQTDASGNKYYDISNFMNKIAGSVDINTVTKFDNTLTDYFTKKYSFAVVSNDNINNKFTTHIFVRKKYVNNKPKQKKIKYIINKKIKYLKNNTLDDNYLTDMTVEHFDVSN